MNTWCSQPVTIPGLVSYARCAGIVIGEDENGPYCARHKPDVPSPTERHDHE